jgi:hypothetical protein
MLAAVGLTGAAVAAATGAYARVHDATGEKVLTFGFSAVLPMKAWLTTGAVALAVVQLVTALWMWGRLPVRGRAPRWAAPVHRASGVAAFLLSLPVAFHCVWSLGFEGATGRVLLHGLLGCLFYGAFAAKMLALRLAGLPGWLLPVLGGTVFSALVLTWASSSLWYFTQSGVALR